MILALVCFCQKGVVFGELVEMVVVEVERGIGRCILDVLMLVCKSNVWTVWIFFFFLVYLFVGISWIDFVGFGEYK